MNLKAFKLKYSSILLIILISFISYNGLLTFCSLLVLLISLNLVTRPNEPPIFSFIIIYHWLQISIKIFHSNIIGESINSSEKFKQAMSERIMTEEHKTKVSEGVSRRWSNMPDVEKSKEQSRRSFACGKERRKEICRNASLARWAKVKNSKSIL